MDGEVIAPRAFPNRFQPGQSGNPGGRTPIPPHIKAALEQHTEKAVAVLAELLDSDDDRVRALAANSLLDRVFGKPAQTLDAKVQSTQVQLGLAHIQALTKQNRQTAEERAEWEAEHRERKRLEKERYLAQLEHNDAREEAMAKAAPTGSSE